MRGWGVKEYFLFDPSGEVLTPRLQGYRLADGAYERMPALESIDRTLTIPSEVLGLELRAKGEEMCFHDPATGLALLSHEEEAAARQEEAAAYRTALARAEEKATARQAAETRAEEEAAARRAAELRAEREAAARRGTSWRERRPPRRVSRSWRHACGKVADLMRTMILPLLPLAALLAFATAMARAAELPPADRLEEQLGMPAATLAVHEPNLSLGGRRVTVEYVGYPAVDVMARLFGKDWQEQAATVELRALDGYVARIDVARFVKETALLAFARADGAPFTVDNPRQNQTDVPLGPWYLVWDNISSPGLLAEGARNWPYQVQEMNLVSLSDSALLPDGLSAEFREGAELARTYCLQCHQVNGFGGEKHPGNLAEIARAYPEPEFTRWVLDPSSMRRGTSMPPLYRHIPDAERRRIARSLFDYLGAVPILR